MRSCARGTPVIRWLRASPGCGPIHFKEETISLCHPERSEGSLVGQRSFATLRMTRLHRLRLTRTSSYLKGIGVCPIKQRKTEGVDGLNERGNVSTLFHC